jgi:hypothetical protein
MQSLCQTAATKYGLALSALAHVVYEDSSLLIGFRSEDIELKLLPLCLRVFVSKGSQATFPFPMLTHFDHELKADRADVSNCSRCAS